ncbi:ABC transporter permease [Pandoraea terrae]|uniref:ABC transporter permease n=1 Tax=Pandoraea terrae TaxID=1537710 RepID=A0A5E4XR10_9BURK|nr:ABC transporter permease [Pandoraea terrae]VVE38515.1 ABC transporter permease [Pandoraea terrae]
MVDARSAGWIDEEVIADALTIATSPIGGLSRRAAQHYYANELLETSVGPPPNERTAGEIPVPSLRYKRVRNALLEVFAAPLLVALMIVLWQVSVPLFGISQFVLPTPLEVLKRIASDYTLLLSHTQVTLYEVLFGFGASILAGIPIALAIFYSRLVEKAIYPVLAGLQTIPKAALAPLLVLYLGYGWAPKIFLAFLISFFPIVISTVVGLQALDKGMVNLARSMGASEWQTFFKIRLPAALPNIFGGLKVGVGLAVIGAIIGEYVAAEKGLGYLQLQATSQFDTTLNFAAVVMISLIGVVLYGVLGMLERRVVYQKESAK